MTPRIAVPLITLVVGVPAFVLGPIIWPPSTASPTPSGAQLPLFAVLFLVEALLFGLGVAFLAFGFPMVKRAAPWAPRKAREATPVVGAPGVGLEG